MVTIFDQFGRPYDRPEKKPARRPLAAAPLTDAYRDYVADGLTPERLGRLLKDADAGDVGRQAELFEQMQERDGHIIGETSKRKNVILDADFTLAPATEDARDVKVCEDVQAMIDGITDWPDILISMQDAMGLGFSAMGMDWDTSEGQARVQQFDFIKHKRFRFTDRAGVLSDVPLLITDDDPLGVDIPAWRIMMHQYGGRSGHPTRSGIFRVCTWWYLFKNYAVKDWVIFCDVYGMPLRLGKYDPGAAEADKEALEIAVRTLGHDAAGIISKSTEIEFITGSKGSVSTDLYKDLAGFGNKEMSKAILGGTLTADVDGKGSYAAANTHNDVRHDLINADARAIAGTVRTQFIRPYVGFNWGWDTPVPKYTGKFKKEDLAAYADLLDKFADRMDIPVSHVREKYSIPEPRKGEECLRAKNTPVSAPVSSKRYVVAKSPNHARNENIAFLDMVSDNLGTQADGHIQETLARVKKIMASAHDIQEMKSMLSRSFSDLEPDDLGELIAKAMAAAELMGRYEVMNDA